MTDTTPRPWFTADWQNDFGTNNVTIESRINNGSTLWPDGIEKRRVASTEDGDNPLADAALIVTAVNAHGDLVKALEAFLEWNEAEEHQSPVWATGGRKRPDFWERVAMFGVARDLARSALAKAKGEMK
jgi:hypothetical protein